MKHGLAMLLRMRRRDTKVTAVTNWEGLKQGMQRQGRLARLHRQKAMGTSWHDAVHVEHTGPASFKLEHLFCHPF